MCNKFKLTIADVHGDVLEEGEVVKKPTEICRFVKSLGLKVTRDEAKEAITEATYNDSCEIELDYPYCLYVDRQVK